MAGGKETPRQKMIGMMYLVLTALLALNVSKAILDAFVAIEKNIQLANVNEWGRGNEKKDELKEKSEDKSSPDAQKKAIKLLQVVAEIDKMTAKQIEFLDNLKIDILKECGENYQGKGEEAIIVEPYKNSPDNNMWIKPAVMDLHHVDGKDKYDEPMLVMGIADDIKEPKGKGKELWDTYMKYRKDLTELIAKSSTTSDKPTSFKDPNITKYKDYKDLDAQLMKAMKNVHPDDVDALKKIYVSLTKQEREDMKEEGLTAVHWVGRTFDHSPSVAAIASLSSMQKEILTARADAVALIRLRVGGGEYSFNKIMPLAYGPDIANNGDDIQLEVLMAAYDSDKQPIVKPNQGTVSEVKDGKGYVKLKASGASNMELTGTITILNKSGVSKTLPYTKTIKIMKPEGTVSLPELQVLYKGYPNKVVGLASGYPETKLSGSGVSLTKSGAYYTAMPTGGKTATISVSGYNEMTKKTANLGTFTFEVRPLPKPQCYWGENSGGRASNKSIRVLKAQYDASIPLKVNFSVTGWFLMVGGREYTGSGASLTEDAMKALRLAKSGAKASFTVAYRGGGSSNNCTAIYDL